MIFAPFSWALRIHLKAIGWFSATLLPSTRIVLQFCKSTQWLVIAPRTERGPQTGDRGAMSKPGLMLDVGQAEQAGRLLKEVALLVGVLRAAHEADGVGPVDGHLSFAALVRDEVWGVLEPIARRAID